MQNRPKVVREGKFERESQPLSLPPQGRIFVECDKKFDAWKHDTKPFLSPTGMASLDILNHVFSTHMLMPEKKRTKNVINE
jgi:hypothetical protein